MDMKFPVVLAASPLLLVVSQAAIPEGIDRAFADFTVLPTELLPVLESVTDRESAENATEKLNNLLPKVYDARTSIQRIPSLPPAVKEEIVSKYGKDMQTNWGKVYEQIFRLQQVRCYNSLSFFKQFHALCMMLDK